MLTLTREKGELNRANSVVNNKSKIALLQDEYSVRNVASTRKKDPASCKSVQDFFQTKPDVA